MFNRWLISCAVVFASGCVVATVRQETPSSFVIILADDLGWADVSCQGSVWKTPSIDALAASGIRFTRAASNGPNCAPSRACLITGTDVTEHGIFTVRPSARGKAENRKLVPPRTKHALTPEAISIAEMLAEKGYRSAFIGKWHLGEEPYGPLQQGFDIQVPRWNKGWPKAGYHAPFRLDGLESKAGEYLTDRLTDEAERFIEASKDRPFFLYLSHFAVHDPIQGRKDLVRKYQRKLQKHSPSEGLGFVLEGNPDDAHPLSKRELTTRLHDPAWSGFRVLPERTVKIKQHQDNVQFAAMVESVDESLGRLLAKLKALDLEENTIVILFSDNGGMSAGNFGNPRRVVAPGRLDRAFSTSNLPLRGAKGWAKQTERLLLARRLVEHGARYVSLNWGGYLGFDSHDNNYPKMRSILPPFDCALAALIEDLYERGLDRDVLVVAWGEFGRTPKVNEKAGRDHWPPVQCALIIGGGLKMGQVIGATDRMAGEPTERPVHVHEILATIYRHCGIDPEETQLIDPTGRPRYLLEHRKPIAELL